VDRDTGFVPLTHRGLGALRTVAALVAAGALGNLVVASARRVANARTARRVAVRAVAGGIVAARWIESATEEARLRAADVLAEAKASLGEEVAPPRDPVEAAGPADGHTH
jgi:uncharacterized protein (DUF697 family)